jgi:alkaline phosphatase D
MLDTRVHGRDKQVDFKPGEQQVPVTDPQLADPKRTLLGFDQETWLARELRKSKDSKQAVAHPRPASDDGAAQPHPGQTIRNPDQWDGYTPTRATVQVLRERDIRNNVVLTGDIHSTWCNRLELQSVGSSATAERHASSGVEFVGPAVSSPAERDQAQAASNSEKIRSVSPHMKYIERYSRGYGILDVTRDRAPCEF